jgi:hypothetical protein
MGDMPGDIGHFGEVDHDPLGFASHDDSPDSTGDTGDLGSEIFDSAPHDPADAIPVGGHTDPTVHADPAAHAAAAGHTQHAGTRHTPAEHAPVEQPHYPPPGSDMQMDINGIHYDAGRIDVDMNGDGHPDTAVIHGERDGVEQVEYYTDNDGDGHADELTITDESGHLISHTEFNEHTEHWDETPLDHQLPTELPDR